MSKDAKQKVLNRTIQRCRERDIIIPTFEEMAHPERIPETIREELKSIGLGDIHPRNLFRISWKNEPVESGGGFSDVNFMEIPSALSGVPARIVFLLGKYFPTGAHKVGATFGPLVSKLIDGEFDPTTQKALWPSTGNYCRGGAFNSRLLACPAIAVLPEGMSRERFQWLEEVGAEIYATPGSESNVKEVYDKTHALKNERPEEVVVLNQFEDFGNSVWHYACTGPAMEEVFHSIKTESSRLAGLSLTQGSAGTLGCGAYLKERYPLVKIAAAEARQCPTLLFNGYGEHRIEGIGDKHVPWIHNLKQMDMIVDVDDEDCIRLMRLFNEAKGRQFLKSEKIDLETVERLDLLGISGIANLLAAVKMARYYEMTEDDILFTVATDSMDLYGSRLVEETEQHGAYSEIQAARDFDRCLLGQKADWMLELSYRDKKRMHNLKYFTWVEQQGKTSEELDAQWNDDSYWMTRLNAFRQWDENIQTFNEQTGLLKNYLS